MGRFLFVALVGTACGRDVTSIVPPPNASVVSGNGVALPLVWAGKRLVLEGWGFGATPGIVRITTVAGTVEVDPVRWTERFIDLVVPAGAATGPIEVVPATGPALSFALTVTARPVFDPTQLSWSPRAALPTGNFGHALAVGQVATSSALETLVMVVGGAAAGESSAVYFARADDDGVVSSWAPRPRLPEPRAHAAAVLATPHSSRRSSTAALYVIGGAGSDGEALNSVVAVSVEGADARFGEWIAVSGLPEGLVGPRAVLRLGMIYLTGGTDAAGRPNSSTYVARIREDGALEGWFAGPPLPSPRAGHGAIALDTTVTVFGGTADSVAGGSPLDTLVPTLDDAARTIVHPQSGFFTSATWITQPSTISGGRRRFATVFAHSHVLAVGGHHPGVGEGLFETVVAELQGDSLGAFDPVSTRSIFDQDGGSLVGAVGAGWFNAQGVVHGLVVGGIDLITGKRLEAGWGF